MGSRGKEREDVIVATMIGGGILGAVLCGAPGALIGAVLGALIAIFGSGDKGE